MLLFEGGGTFEINKNITLKVVGCFVADKFFKCCIFEFFSGFKFLFCFASFLYLGAKIFSKYVLNFNRTKLASQIEKT